VLTSLNDLAAGRRRASDELPARQRLQGLVEKSPEQIGPDALLFTQLRLLPTAASEPASQMAQHRDSPAPGSGYPTESAVDRLLRAARLTYAGRLNAALDLLDQAAPPDSLRMVHWMLRGRLQLEKGLAREAVSSFSMMLADHADSPIVYLNRGLASFHAGQLKEAEQDFTSVINLDPGNAAGWVNRAFVRAAQRQTSAAIDDVNEALQWEPDSNKLLLIRSRWLREAGRLQEARADYDRALQRPPVTADDWVSVALARLPGEPQRALADLQSAETLHGASSTILQSMAHVYSEHLQQPAEAMRMLDRLLEAQPRFQKALAGRAVLHARAGRTQNAREDLQKLSALDSDLTAESIYQMACTLAICSSRQPEMRPEALKQLARAVRRGYGGQLLKQDPDLDSIRDSEEFRHIEAAWQLTGDP
jgi:tetratricopeptide (TPR) repeat protein